MMIRFSFCAFLILLLLQHHVSSLIHIFDFYWAIILVRNFKHQRRNIALYVVLKKESTQQQLQQFCLVIEKFRKLRLHPEAKWKGRNSLEILYHDTDKSNQILFWQSIPFIDFFFGNQFHSQISRYGLRKLDVQIPNFLLPK